MKTECHNVAGRMILKALRKSPLGAGLVNMDIGSGDKLVKHNLQIPARVMVQVWYQFREISGVRGLQGVYNGGLQPETLADGSW
eukprot:1160457-Pelagomonas_calceolata.AAC.1